MITPNCLKIVRIRSFSGLYFLAFGLNTGIYSVYLHIQYNCRKMRKRKNPNTDDVHAVPRLQRR